MPIQRDLVLKQAETAGTTLWVALRMMEERKHLLRKLKVEGRQKGYSHQVSSNVEKQGELEQHINKLKEIYLICKITIPSELNSMYLFK